ncbi:hypothetical protein [Acetobacter syzygii]|uniref:hypothetical protein n=1 Tax=Acetobacter syzygii TaxID=146476 RepID=UPI00156E56C8|nr:hypothetical protein [Acetobacter syzygii]NSL93901.1 hypothetical protein [Acetobacter syzygii]
MADNAHEIVLTEETKLMRGDKVRVGPDADVKFSSRIGQSAKCVNGDIGSDIIVQFDDEEIIEGPRAGLILTAYYTGAAPGGAE